MMDAKKVDMTAGLMDCKKVQLKVQLMVDLLG